MHHFVPLCRHLGPELPAETVLGLLTCIPETTPLAKLDKLLPVCVVTQAGVCKVRPLELAPWREQPDWSEAPEFDAVLPPTRAALAPGTLFFFFFFFFVCVCVCVFKQQWAKKKAKKVKRKHEKKTLAVQKQALVSLVSAICY